MAFDSGSFKTSAPVVVLRKSARRINTFMTPYGDSYEQNLVQSMMEEIIQIHGVEIWYLPRTAVRETDLLGEDTLSHYKSYKIMEAMPVDVNNWAGEGDTITRFGTDFKDYITFQITKHRWQQDYPSKPRPLEGDLIWFPMSQKMFVINFVEHEKMFYPLGKLMTYQLTCNLFDYSSERIDTGEQEVDIIEDEFSNDMLLDYALYTANNELLLTHAGEPILLSNMLDDVQIVDESNAYANNELIQTEAEEDMEYDDQHPFLIDQRRY